jgi:AcrR family transcriptional regulator
MTDRDIRARLIEAAFALFEERGYESTTVDQIADRAGVGRTTFFRTFRSKEDVIFPDHDAVLNSIGARLANSTQQTALVAVSEAARLVLLHYLEEGDLALARYRLTRGVPALRAREIAGTLKYQQIFREFIHDWMGGGQESALRAEMMAGAVVTAHNYVLRRWLRGVTDRPRAEFDDAMTRTVDLFTEHPPEPGQRSIVVFDTDKDVATILPALRTLLGDPTEQGRARPIGEAR